jgi:predicted ATPase
MFSQCRRDAAATYTRAAALITTAAAQGFENRVEHGHILQGWALSMQGEVAVGITLLCQGLAATEGTSLQLFRPYFRTLLAHIPPNLVVEPRYLRHLLEIVQSFPHPGASAATTI